MNTATVKNLYNNYAFFYDLVNSKTLWGKCKYVL